MALRIEINLNKLLDRPTIGDYALSRETFDLYRIVATEEGNILLVNVETALVGKKFENMAHFLSSEFLEREFQIIKEENFKLINIEPDC